MVITHHGGQCFKVTFGDLTLVFDPISKGGTLPAVRFGADIALVSGHHQNYNGIEEVTYAGKAPFVIEGPGEYERAGVTVRGFLSPGPGGSINTVYAVELEAMTLVHLGALASEDLPAEAREGATGADVLFVPVGGPSTALGTGDGVLAPAAAHELAAQLEPKIIVPMHWSGIGKENALEAFLKEAGGSGEKVDKFTLKKRDLAGREGSILVIMP